MVYKSLCYTKNKSQCWHPVISGKNQELIYFKQDVANIQTEEQKNFSNIVAGKR